MPNTPASIIDTFAMGPWQGNPAAVLLCPDGFPSTAEMQGEAARISLPTTAFVLPQEPTVFAIRWFTPEKELNICGHATIASVAYLAACGRVHERETLTFNGPNGPLYARHEGDRVHLTLPIMELVQCPPPASLVAALGQPVLYCARAVDDILMELESEQAVRDLRPDFAALREYDCRGHIVTARSERAGMDFVSRTFFPALGVDEDQVCVSAHCKLGPYWSARLGRTELRAVQLSQRGGQLDLRVRDTSIEVTARAVLRERPLNERRATI